MGSIIQDWLALPTLGLAIALVVTVIGARLTADSANLTLGLAWILATISIFTMPSIAQSNLIPRILYTLLFSSMAGLGLYQLRWVEPTPAVVNQPVQQIEKTEEQILAEEKAARSPQFDVKIFPWPSEAVTPYKPPLKQYVLGIQNINKNSVPVLDLRMEFHFRNIIAEVKPQVLLTGGGNMSVSGMKRYEQRKDGPVSAYEEKALPSELSKKFVFTIQQATINKKSTNLNFVDLYVERWIEEALFSAEIIINTAKGPSISKKPGEVNSYNGMYFYEIRGKNSQET